jgi:secondary thiamine-phosphate synthase enzyme
MSTPYKRLLSFDTASKSEIRTITAELNQCIADSGLENGTFLVYSLHTTLGLIIQETSEPFLCEDFTDFLTNLVNDDGNAYKHRCALHPSGACSEDRFNAPSHVRQLLTNQSLVLDVQGGRLSLGQWQDVALLELDGPRPGRQILVKIWSDAVPFSANGASNGAATVKLPRSLTTGRGIPD